MEIVEIDIKEAYRVIHKFHYSKVLPKLTKHVLANYNKEGLPNSIMTLGWGVRPKHTIQKLFPSLNTKDYYEIGKLCLDDELPRNSESHFISQCLKYIKHNFSDIKLIFTWADGMLGKPGYVYQASNFYYGGYIWTDSYFCNGEKIHPRATGKIGGRPTKEELDSLGWEHYRGKQFRYCYFTCHKKEEKRLLRESGFSWTKKEYPKQRDLCWKRRNNDGWDISKEPNYNGSMSFNSSANMYNWYFKHPTLESFMREKSQERDV